MKLETKMLPGDITVVSLGGELDYNSSEEARQQLMEVVENNKNVVIDCVVRLQERTAGAQP